MVWTNLNFILGDAFLCCSKLKVLYFATFSLNMHQHHLNYQNSGDHYQKIRICTIHHWSINLMFINYTLNDGILRRVSELHSCQGWNIHWRLRLKETDQHNHKTPYKPKKWKPKHRVNGLTAHFHAWVLLLVTWFQQVYPCLWCCCSIGTRWGWKLFKPFRKPWCILKWRQALRWCLQACFSAFQFHGWHSHPSYPRK